MGSVTLNSGDRVIATMPTLTTSVAVRWKGRFVGAAADNVPHFEGQNRKGLYIEFRSGGVLRVACEWETHDAISVGIELVDMTPGFGAVPALADIREIAGVYYQGSVGTNDGAFYVFVNGVLITATTTGIGHHFGGWGTNNLRLQGPTTGTAEVADLAIWAGNTTADVPATTYFTGDTALTGSETLVQHNEFNGDLIATVGNNFSLFAGSVEFVVSSLIAARVRMPGSAIGLGFGG